MICPCSHPANAPVGGRRLNEMQRAGVEGCRRCQGTGVSVHCSPCAGTGAVADPRETLTCPSCAGVGRVPEREAVAA